MLTLAWSRGQYRHRCVYTRTLVQKRFVCSCVPMDNRCRWITMLCVRTHVVAAPAAASLRWSIVLFHTTSALVSISYRATLPSLCLALCLVMTRIETAVFAGGDCGMLDLTVCLALVLARTNLVLRT